MRRLGPWPPAAAVSAIAAEQIGKPGEGVIGGSSRGCSGSGPAGCAAAPPAYRRGFAAPEVDDNRAWDVTPADGENGTHAIRSLALPGRCLAATGADGRDRSSAGSCAAED